MLIILRAWSECIAGQWAVLASARGTCDCAIVAVHATLGSTTVGFFWLAPLPIIVIRYKVYEKNSTQELG